MESDETRIFNAAHLMVASLAGCLAHVTCKVFLILNFVDDSILVICGAYYKTLWLIISYCFFISNQLAQFVCSRNPYEVQYQVNSEVLYKVWVLPVICLSRLYSLLQMITLILVVPSLNRLPRIRSVIPEIVYWSQYFGNGLPLNIAREVSGVSMLKATLFKHIEIF